MLNTGKEQNQCSPCCRLWSSAAFLLCATVRLPALPTEQPVICDRMCVILYCKRASCNRPRSAVLSWYAGWASQLVLVWTGGQQEYCSTALVSNAASSCGLVMNSAWLHTGCMYSCLFNMHILCTAVCQLVRIVAHHQSISAAGMQRAAVLQSTA